jgi:hypothetical protein
MVGVGAPCPTMGSSPEGNEKGDRGEEVGARCWGAREAGGGLQEGSAIGAPPAHGCFFMLCSL